MRPALEFTAIETTTTRMLGPSRDNATTDYTDIDFGIMCTPTAASMCMKAAWREAGDT